MPDGRNLVVTFTLVSSLFLLWGVCNGMIDTMDKHFQTELGLSKAQSAWVQFAHYLGYFLMALPAGLLASKLGYKGGIIAGLLMVAAGGFWFLPAAHINALAKAGSVSPTTAFIGYLAGVLAIMGGAILPKLMGAVADKNDMSRGYIVPMACFAFVALYGFSWSKLAKSEGMLNVSPVKGH